MQATLTANDRCDRCPAQAQTEWQGSLLFCGHHSREYGPALLADGYTITNTSADALAEALTQS